MLTFLLENIKLVGGAADRFVRLRGKK